MNHKNHKRPVSILVILSAFTGIVLACIIIYYTPAQGGGAELSVLREQANESKSLSSGRSLTAERLLPTSIINEIKLGLPDVDDAVVSLNDTDAASADKRVTNDAIDCYGENEDSDDENDYAFEIELELPVNGATGFAAVELDVFSSQDDDEIVQTLEPGSAFMICEERGDWWRIEADDITGWVKHEYCMINLPDVIPSIIYDNTNAYRSLFMSNSYGIPDVSGLPLYPNGGYNKRLGRNEYNMAVMYSASKSIYAAQQNALAEGDCLLIIEAFRPRSAQKLISDSLRTLAGEVPEVNNAINTAPWDISWFIAGKLSGHQMGYSIDVVLVKVEQTVNLTTGGCGYIQVIGYTEYETPTRIHDLSINSALFRYPYTAYSYETFLQGPLTDAVKNSDGVMRLQKYCIQAGLSPLASEWWHFNDAATKNSLTRPGTGEFTLTENYSMPPGRA